MGTDVMDIVESVNIAKFIPELASEPRDSFLNPWIDEIEDFSRVNTLHHNVNDDKLLSDIH